MDKRKYCFLCGWGHKRLCPSAYLGVRQFLQRYCLRIESLVSQLEPPPPHMSYEDNSLALIHRKIR